MNEVDYTTKFEQIIKSMAYNDVKSVQIRSYFWSLFSCIRTEYGDLRVQIRSYFWSVFSRIRNEYGEKNVQIRSYFWSVFSLFRTEYGEILRTEYGKIRTRKSSIFGHFLRSGGDLLKNVCSRIISKGIQNFFYRYIKSYGHQDKNEATSQSTSEVTMHCQNA